MKCENCGNESGNTNFCPHCGAESKAARVCAVCGATYDSRFCPHCGNTHQPVAQATATETRPQTVVYEPQDLMQGMPQEPQAPSPPPLYAEPVPTFATATPPVAEAAPSPTIVINNMVQSENSNTNANTSENTHTQVHTAEQSPAYTQVASSIYPPAPVTVNMGPTINYQTGVSPKNRTVALVLCLLLGALGIHRFYAGKVGTGILYFFTGGLFGIGYLVDVIMIATGTFTDSSGLPIKNWNA